MNLVIYKVSLKGVWDSKINDSFRNLLKLNGFVLKSDDDNFGYEWNDYGGYPEGHDFSIWYKDDQYQQFTYSDYPAWIPENKKESQLLLLPEDFANLMFMLELQEEKIKFESISKSTIVVDHPVEKMMKECFEVLTNGFSNSILKYMMKQKEE